MIELENNKVMVQIGTNSGKDLFRDLVLKYKPSQIILIEPNIKLIKVIAENYKDISNVTIVNKAININNDKVELFLPAKDKKIGNPGENGHIYEDGNFSMLPMNDWGDKKNMIKIECKSITFLQLCKRYKLTDIHYLQIDTEGFDAQIINSIDFNTINIDIIRYEKWNFPIDRYTRYHSEECYKNYGINGMESVKNKLVNLGYKLTNINDRDGNDIIARK